MLAMASDMDALASADETRAVAERLGRYFTRGLPMHTRDEEESLLPRLGGLESVVALDTMHREHLEHDSLVRTLVTSCRRLLDAPPSRGKELRAKITQAAEAVATVMVPHLLAEEQEVFPLVGRLDDVTQSRILEEMEARRAAGR
jgi:iron-sulfur cluster repair protein YtfE (RIC family)